ncbi:hypothetical protein ACFL6B_01880 [Thermodesulfobacteriota bacterium]
MKLYETEEREMDLDAQLEVETRLILKPAPLEDKINANRLFENEPSDFQRFSFRKLAPVILRNIKLLSYKLDVHQAMVARSAVAYGMDRFRWFKQIDEIKDAYITVYHADKDKLKHLKMGQFDLGTSEGEPRDYTFRKERISEITGLADKLGLPAGTLFQLAMIAGLIESYKISIEDCNSMIETLRRFYKKLKNHTEFVLEIKRQCEEKARTKITQVEPKRLTWKDVIS